MKTFQTSLLTVIVLATSACASNAVKHQAAPSAAEIRTAPATVANSRPEATPNPALAMPPDHNAASTTEAAAGSGSITVTGGSGKSEPDIEAPGAQTHVRDPWEGFNRRVHSFNNTADNLVLRPLAVGYKKVAPEPIRAGVSRFFDNLRMPRTAVNEVLQGRPGDAVQSLGRFTVNTTIGIVGVFDPASRFGMPHRDGEDFGQTLATWGWRDSRYLVLPLLGPRTLRDAAGILGDQQLSPIAHIRDNGTASALQMLEIVDMRTLMLPIDEFRGNALDDYTFVRDAWTQRRNSQIQKDRRSSLD